MVLTFVPIKMWFAVAVVVAKKEVGFPLFDVFHHLTRTNLRLIFKNVNNNNNNNTFKC